MARTNPKAVIAVLGSNYDTINCPLMTPYIRAASLMVTRADECATAIGYTLTSTELEEMERWVAAHFYTISDPIYLSKQTGNSSASYPERSYLDIAKMLDPSGCLSSLASANITPLDFEWLGKEPSNQIDYDQRR